MASGGSRSRSGPPPDPKSRTSERKGYTLTALPGEGYKKAPPGLKQFMPAATARHQAVWKQLWSTPQACAWSMEPWRWLVVADLVKWMVRSDDPEAPTSTATNVRQLREDLGLSPVGLRVNGWAIVTDQLAARRDDKDEAATALPKRPRRLRSADA